ncbi:MAG: outer membrane beta-barrel protein [Pseudomonadota bacterium]|nr:hypothetical protein [Pseudomonadales bacterium]MDY6921981.1 outer membrane beta-barrel protein [Pseudomonadota bacterium]
MKKRFSFGVLLGVLLATSAYGAERGFSNSGLIYFGGSLGQSSYDELDDLAVEGDAVTDVSVSKDAIGVELFAGLSLLEVLALEMAIIDLGDFRIKEEYVNGADRLDSKLTGQTRAAGGLIKLALPVNADVDVYARLGAMYWKTEVDISSKSYSSGVYQGLVSDSIDADGVAPFVSLGTEYRVNANYALTLEYKYLDAEIDDDGVTSDQPVSGIYAGFKYYLGGTKLSRSYEKRRRITACDEEFRDVSGLICDEAD